VCVMRIPKRDQYSFRSRYRIVEHLLKGRVGTLLDVGARDKTLERYVDKGRIHYLSADREGPHDFQITLGESIAVPDRQFDYVTSLDVLEHVDDIHVALGELLRIAKKLVIVSLPNMASYPHRFSFLARGRLGTDKYNLSPMPRNDRHRWLTTYEDSRRFVEANAAKDGFRVTAIIGETEGGELVRVLSWCCLIVGLPLSSLLVTRVIFVLAREDT
jgi:Methyltransferase domain